ncbi:hypothetical protein KQI65_07665 [bacterium]|nr:hypothetical protein [bacterium]
MKIIPISNDKFIKGYNSGMKYFLIAIFIAGSAQYASAQTIPIDASENNRIYLRSGIEPTTMIAFGYQRNVPAGIINRTVTAYAEWNTSMVRFGVDNSELRIGGIVPIYGTGALKVFNDLHLSAGSLETRNFDSKKFAVGDELAVGYYPGGWFLAATAEYETVFLNKIEHSDFYRTTFYADARDGWYSGAGGMFQFGFETGVRLFDNYDLHLEAKLPFTEKFKAYGGSPMHVNLGLGYRF